jgi:hypothetical protein
VDSELLAHLQRIEVKLDALSHEVHLIVKPDLAEIKRRASFWGAVGGSVAGIISLITQLSGCL